MKSRLSTDSAAQVDLTPMLDVVFILLIFFIVTAAFLREKSLPVQSSEAASNRPSDRQTLLFEVTADNQVRLNSRFVDISAIRAIVAQQYAQYADRLSVVVRANEQADVRVYVAIADATRMARAGEVSLITQ